MRISEERNGGDKQQAEKELAESSQGKVDVKPKSLFLIRHGESEYNQWRRETIYNCTWVFKEWTQIDAGLTENGELQVKNLKASRIQATVLSSVDLVVTSPLTRAIETALKLFPHSGVRIVATHLHAERLDHACDIGRPLSDLKQKYPSVDFSEIDKEYWWYGGKGNDKYPFQRESVEECQKRIGEFKSWLRARSENRIAVVGHSGYFMLFTQTNKRLRNCEVMELLFQ